MFYQNKVIHTNFIDTISPLPRWNTIKIVLRNNVFICVFPTTFIYFAYFKRIIIFGDVSNLHFNNSLNTDLFKSINWNLSIFHNQFFALPFLTQNTISFCCIKNYVAKTDCLITVIS